MTVDLSEGETESKPRIPSASGFKDETSVGPRDRDLLKNGHWKDAKEADKNPVSLEEQAGDGDSGNYSGGTADLTTGFKDSLIGRVRVPNTHASGQGKLRGGRLRSSESRKVPVLSSEGDGDEETEDDFDEGNGPVAAAVSEVQNEQQNQQEQSREHLQKPERKDPQEQVLPAAQPPVGWESFLPQRNVKVLLAEDDDSTRQVVGALLRNCSYEVSSVANGMQAWEMLQDPNNQFDLVLTDVVMPCLSGVGLLTKITSNESGKRIPVIMMSSHDSLDIVFRCLSKGAADFLVKPVRKNELKNLWQHVWRCQSSSGSGSGGSGTGSGNGKGTRAKSRVGSGNNSGSNDGSDDNSSGLNVRGGSDNGSGTQAVVHPLNKQKRDKPDVEEGQATSLQKLSNHQMGQDLEMATRRPTPSDIEKCQADKQDSAKVMQEDSPSTSGNSGNKLEKDSGGALSGGSSAKAIDLIGGISFQNNEDVDEGVESGEGSARGASNSPANDKCGTSSTLPPLLELSLKRPRAPGEDGNNEKRALRHSGGSAFSRYSTSGTTIQQTPIRNPLYFAGYAAGGPYGTHALSPATGPLGMGNGVQGHLSSPIDRVDSSKGIGVGSTPKPMHPRISHKGNGQDMGSSTIGSSTPEGYPQQAKDEVVSVSPMSGKSHPLPLPLPPRGMIYDNMSAAYGPALHQVFYTHSGAPPWASGTAHFSERGEVFDCPPYQNHGSHTAHHSSQHHQQHPRHSRVPQLSVHPQQEDQVVTNQASGAPRCGSSTMAGSVPDGNAGQSGSSNGYGSAGNCNGSVNGSGSGSNNMNNQNGQSGVAQNASQNADCAGNNGNGSGGVTGGFGHEQNRFARREAALNKFRQKRKERCFEKKVRYQSRKRLAEQRPRVRGQFVRQAVYDSNAGNDMADL